MVQLLTWEWLARDIMFQLYSWWQVYRATMEEIRAGHGVLDVQANHRDGKKDQDSGRNRARTRWLCIREKEPWYWDWTAWESPRPVRWVCTSHAFCVNISLKREFKATREIDPVFPCQLPPPPVAGKNTYNVTGARFRQKSRALGSLPHTKHITSTSPSQITRPTPTFRI